jgi:hypothetical protein
MLCAMPSASIPDFTTAVDPTEQWETAARHLSFELWQLVLKLHAMLEADPDEAAEILVKVGILLRIDELAGLRRVLDAENLTRAPHAAGRLRSFMIYPLVHSWP